MIRLIFKSIAALFLGLLVTLFVAQDDVRFKTFIEHQLQQLFEQKLSCSISCTLKNINLFRPNLELANVHVQARDRESWSWSAARYDVRFSWFRFLLTGVVDMYLELDDVKLNSVVEGGKAPLMDHLYHLFKPSPHVPLTLKKLVVRKALLSMHDRSTKDTFKLVVNGEASKECRTLKAQLQLFDGTIMRNRCDVVRGMQGTVQFDVNYATEAMSHGYCSLGCDVVPWSSDDHCFVKGAWDGKHGHIALHNKQGTLVTHTCTLQRKNGALLADVNCSVPLSYLVACGGQQVPFLDGTESVAVQGKLNLSNPQEENVVTVSCAVPSYNAQLACTLEQSRDQWRGIVHGSVADQEVIDGSLGWSPSEQTGWCTVQNKAPFVITRGWCVEQDQLCVDVKCNEHGELAGSYGCHCVHASSGRERSVQGTLRTTTTELVVAGSCNDDHYEVRCSYDDGCTVERVSYRSAQDNDICLLERHDDVYVVAIDYPVIKALVRACTNYDVTGHGKLTCTAWLKHGLLYIDGVFSGGSVRIPHVYNFLQDIKAHATIDMSARKVVLEDLEVRLHKGTVRSSRSTVWLNDRGIPVGIHVPLILENCFLHMHKDLFAAVSGYTVFSYQGDAPCLKGTLLLDRSHLKGNILSHELQQNVAAHSLLSTQSPYGILLDLHLMTRYPLVVKTSFLQATATIDAVVQGSVDQPEVTGIIQLLNGSLAFPYRPLHITHGSLRLVSHGSTPHIELVAKNKVKKYNVALTVNGPIDQPHIAFSSTPGLKEEEIITLLLAGSEEGALTMVMPTLIMQNIQELLLGPAQSSSRLERYFKRILRPLGYVRLVPGFSDQSGRGGFRGALEIEVNDRLHGSIQKNFSLSEDTRFEVEYLLSDDVTVRGIKDERGDLGGELEIRCKF